MKNEAIPLSSLKPDPRLEADLRWFFQQAEGEMGLRSNWEAYAREGMFLTRRRSTFSVDLTALHVDLRGAERELTIRKALNELAPAARGTLAVAFGDLREVTKAWPEATENDVAELQLVFRELTGLVPFVAFGEHQRSRTTRPLVEWLVRLARRVKKDPAAWRTVTTIRQQAEARLMSAARAYAGAKRGTRRHAR